MPTFIRYTVALSDNDPSSCIEHAIGFVNWSPKQIYERVAFLANKKSLNNINITKAIGRGSINLGSVSLSDLRSGVPELVPERTVHMNYRSEHIVPGHLSVLEYCVSSISGAASILSV
jgi:hypothetical protein